MPFSKEDYSKIIEKSENENYNNDNNIEYENILFAPFYPFINNKNNIVFDAYLYKQYKKEKQGHNTSNNSLFGHQKSNFFNLGEGLFGNIYNNNNKNSFIPETNIFGNNNSLFE